MKLNKKITAGVVAAALIFSAATGFTLAYFTDSTQEDSNITTMGHVDITLSETSKQDQGILAGEASYQEDVLTGFEYAGVMPGDVYSKIPLVTVVADNNQTPNVDEASQPAYIRVMLTLKVTDPDGNNADNSALNVDGAALLAMLDIDDSLWNVVVADDSGLPGTLVAYAYFDPEAAALTDGLLLAGESATLFTTVSFPFEMDNNNTDDSYLIDIKAEAIQAQNFTPLDLDGDNRVDSWGGADIQEYVAS